MHPTVKNRKGWNQLRMKIAQKKDDKKREREGEKSWCDNDRKETSIRVLVGKN